MYCVTFVITDIQKHVSEGLSLTDAARRVATDHRSICWEVLDIIGSWPSSERELNALQRVMP